MARWQYLKFIIVSSILVFVVACSGGGGDAGGSGGPALSWVPPSERADNSALSLSELSGYRIYYGTSSGNYQNRIEVAGGAIDSTTFDGVPPGTYYIVVTAVDLAGQESDYSEEVKITI